MNAQNVVVKSRGFNVWKTYEAVNGRVVIEKIVEETGLGLSTVRKFIAEPDTVVNQAAILGAAVLADYFGVTLDAFLTVEEKGGNQ